MTTRTRSHTALALFSVALIVAAGIAEARGGRGGGFGSRGMRTFEPPAVTRTAPRPAQPIERSTTQPGAPGVAGQPGAARPGIGQTASRPGGFFNRPGFMGGLFGGLLGAGLIGMLFGSGFLGGLSGLGSFLGLALQLLLVFFLVRWAMRAFARRSQPAMAGGPGFGAGPAHGTAPLRRVDAPSAGGQRAGTPLSGIPPLSSRAPSRNPDELGVTQGDLDQFERILGEVQEAYSAEDAARLRRHTTPEMLSYFLEELTDNASRGVVNRVSDVKLLSGDVAESWREGDTEYATGAMRFGLVDETLERETGRVVETGPSEATELWTFRRARGGQWLLSAIQQA
jgi:predicted lipid-binding transport protein (Tim44 family)